MRDDTSTPPPTTSPTQGRSTYVPTRRACRHPFLNPYYVACVAFSIFVMCRQFSFVSEFSRDHHREIRNSHLQAPWAFFAALGSTAVDFGDNQWRGFCNNFPTLLPFMALLVCVSQFLRGKEDQQQKEMLPISPSAYRFSLSKLAIFHSVAGIIYAMYLHGPRIIFMFILVLTNYFVIAPLCRRMPFRAWLACVWIFHIGVLLVNHRNRGYSLRLFFGESAAKYDQYGEVMPWNIVFNMSTLRMIAYCIDYEEAVHRGGHELRTRLEEKHRTNCTECVSRKCACYKLRTETPRPMAEYNLVHYLAYLFYVPLYIAGPMSSFNAYVSHVYSPQRWFKNKDALRYAGRILGLFATLMFLLHFAHLHSIMLHPTLFAKSEVAVKVSFFVLSLAFLWLKFSIFWKFFRLVSLLDGFDVPEDMVRCFASVTTIANFWRDWHASFNIWIIRYMYIPMGGSRFKVLAIFPIFSFIALWHDIEMRLFWWAGIICIAFMPEAIGTAFFSQRKFAWIHNARCFPQLRVMASYISIMSLILGNLVGYGAASRDTGDGASNVLSDFMKSFDVALFLILPLTSSYITWYLVDREREAVNRLRWDCGLAVTISPGPTPTKVVSNS